MSCPMPPFFVGKIHEMSFAFIKYIQVFSPLKVHGYYKVCPPSLFFLVLYLNIPSFEIQNEMRRD